jgi:hypothetical protein
MKEATLDQLREWATNPIPDDAPAPVYQERRAALGALVRGGEDDENLLRLLETLANRENDHNHPLAGNIETLNARVAQFAQLEAN